MGKRLVIAEKPSMAKDIAKAIGGKSASKDGHIDCGNVLVTWARGHLLETLPPDKLNPDWKVWRLKTLPMIPTDWKMAPREDAKKQLKVVVDLAKSADVTEIVNACDAGREGQLIFDEIMVYAKIKKPILRLWTSSLTESAIQAAWKALEPHSKRQGTTDAAWCRQRADWLVGLNATRAQTLMVQSHHQNAGTQNIGRVQTPTLKLLVDRELEIRNFVPKDFFQVLGTFKADAGVYSGRWFRLVEGKIQDRLEKEAEAQALVAKVRGKAGVVKSNIGKDVREQPDLLFDLTTLQREANKKHGFTSEKTLEIAQSLYEAKVLTYPRTNSRYLTPDVMKDLVPKAIQTLSSGAYAPFVGKLKTPLPSLSSRFVDAAKVEDHHAIIPTENDPGTLSSEQRAIYDMVVRRLIGAFYPDRILYKTEIITEVEGELFKTNGTIVKQEGWAEVDPSSSRKKSSKKGDDDGDEDAADSLPAVKSGDSAALPNTEIKRGKTTPPKPYSEGDLLGAMESAGKDIDEDELREAMKDSGLGTPATRASIIEELVRRKFVERKRTSMIPTEAGIMLIARIKHPILASPALTGEWEKKLKDMEHGKYARDAFNREIEAFVTKIVEEIRAEANMSAGDGNGGGAGRFEPVEKGTCEKCGSTLMLKAFDGEFYIKCSGNGCRVTYQTNQDGAPLKTCKFDGCGGAVYTTKGKKEVCQKCEKWQDSDGTGGGAAVSAGSCPKCKSELKVWSSKFKQGEFYAQCSNRSCKVSYGTDAAGKALEAPCKNCGGAVKATQSGSRICVACDTWQDEKPAGGGAGGGTVVGECPKCKGSLALKKWKDAYYVKCSGTDCKVSYDTDSQGKPKKKCKFCKEPVKKIQSGSEVCVACGKWQEDKKK